MIGVVSPLINSHGYEPFLTERPANPRTARWLRSASGQKRKLTEALCECNDLESFHRGSKMSLVPKNGWKSKTLYSSARLSYLKIEKNLQNIGYRTKVKSLHELFISFQKIYWKIFRTQITDIIYKMTCDPPCCWHGVYFPAKKKTNIL